MHEITDEFMHSQLPTAKTYTVVLLKKGPRYGGEGTDSIVWEHGRRNFSLRADGRLAIVMPIAGDSDVRGLGIFDLPVAQTEELMDEDPGVAAGVFVYEAHSARGFPGDSLPQ
jgi:hypothetical protein